MNKREFLRCGCELALVAGSIGPARALAALPTGRMTMNGQGAAMFDGRYPESVQFAARCAAAGAMRVAVQADCAGLWHGGLLATGVAELDWIAGLTNCSDFEVMRSCARAHGLRDVFTGQHDGRSGDRIRHALSHRGADFDAHGICHGAGWAARLADALMSHDLADGSARTVTAYSSRSDRFPGTLFSWVLARPATTPRQSRQRQIPKVQALPVPAVLR